MNRVYNSSLLLIFSGIPSDSNVLLFNPITKRRINVGCFLLLNICKSGKIFLLNTTSSQPLPLRFIRTRELCS